MNILNASLSDLDEILKIYEDARKFMYENNNKTQWLNYPSEDLIKKDIEEKDLYICVDKSKILAVFYYKENIKEEHYEKIEGSWLDDSNYSVVHRIATKRGTNGIATYCLDYLYNKSGNLKIDTHRDNIPMLSLLKKLNFKYCGIVRLANNEERLAFQKKKEFRF